ncbi:hypothetical protein FZ103_04225 [Streptomonospora sp. PA3]|uniref:hypothetical protein n=1 Tax=Streptomonospora sp. PA3 TaxID=2607326 RepID=UPI0012DF14D0|nr:hypothetical protein [Streptomonospora sp. PA3]MUL40392.1 hypothetical protein [Streptomonospora sp. PA3]
MPKKDSGFSEDELRELYRLSRSGVPVGKLVKRFGLSEDLDGVTLIHQALFEAGKLVAEDNRTERLRVEAQRAYDDTRRLHEKAEASNARSERNKLANRVGKKLADQEPFTDDEREFVLNHLKETT